MIEIKEAIVKSGMQEQINIFVEYMKENGWNVEYCETQPPCLPKVITDRYGNIPEQWLSFTSEIQYMTNADETMWFLCAGDYNIQGDVAFQWNDWEYISLESAQDDEDWQAEIKRFWDGHFPIIMSVRDGYAYYAVSMEDGSIVKGVEPEFEECRVVASSFVDFMEKVVSGQLRL